MCHTSCRAWSLRSYRYRFLLPGMFTRRRSRFVTHCSSATVKRCSSRLKMSTARAMEEHTRRLWKRLLRPLLTPQASSKSLPPSSSLSASCRRPQYQQHRRSRPRLRPNRPRRSQHHARALRCTMSLAHSRKPRSPVPAFTTCSWPPSSASKIVTRSRS